MANQPLTRTELVEALAGQKQDLVDVIRASAEESRRELHGALAATKAEILEHVQEYVRDVQTEVLKALHPYQEGQNARLRLVEVRLSNIDAGMTERVAIVEQRLAEIERKLLLHPPPPTQ